MQSDADGSAVLELDVFGSRVGQDAHACGFGDGAQAVDDGLPAGGQCSARGT